MTHSNRISTLISNLIPTVNRNPAPKVAVVIVNYNAGEWLTQCVISVLRSTLSAAIYIVDNASTDNSLSLLRHQLVQPTRVDISRFPTQLIQNTENLGFAAAVNQGIIASGETEYVLVLNPDCEIEPDTLAKFCQTMAEYPQHGMAGCLVRNTDGTEQAGCRRGIPSPWRSVVRVLHLDKLFPQEQKFKSFVLTQEQMPTEPMEIEGISGACMFVRREALQQVGLMDESYFLHCEDLDWFMRFRDAGRPLLFIPHIEVTHSKGFCSRKKPVSVLWYKHRGMIRFYRKFFKKQYPAFLYWGVVSAVWTRFALLASVLIAQQSVGSVKNLFSNFSQTVNAPREELLLLHTTPTSSISLVTRPRKER